MLRFKTVFAFVLCAVLYGAAGAEPKGAREGDFVVRNFEFRSGQTLDEVNLHYTTLGKPERDSEGRIVNAVMILHGTGGTGRQFFRPQFADVLFKKGGLLDPAKYFIILPDNIGHGKSSKPSDGLRARFPEYDYHDMVALQHRLLTEGLGVERLRLLMGTSMGCMHGFMWGEIYPDFVEAMMPLACQPVEIAGRNRMWRKLSIDAIRNDPDWKGGEYEEQPEQALRTVASLLLIAGGSAIPLQEEYPTRAAVDPMVEARVAGYIDGMDANDWLYQVSASKSYDPLRDLEKIKARVVWINSADDFINPPELGVAERAAARLENGEFVLIPASAQTHGHGTHTWAALWEDHLARLLADTAPAKN
ncbi:MAG: alpha/beta fold hydrolase [Parvularculaceae bacterium]|nr:alpha/beta fold hydrolase [Parvularculaceae bacterium]